MPNSNSLKSRCLAETLGTFAIVFFGCGAIAVNHVSYGNITHIGIALTFGITLMVMIHILGPISGAHFNPAVTLAMTVKRNFPKRDLVPYILSQFFGAVVGAFLMGIMIIPPLSVKQPATFFNQPSVLLGVTQPLGQSTPIAFAWEFVLTAILMIVILNVTTDYRITGPNAAVTIGALTTAAVLIAGPICGASMNPARSLGPAVIAFHYDHLLIYLIAPVCGAITGAIFNDQLHRRPKTRPTQ